MVSSIVPARQESRPPRRKPRSGGTPGFPKRTIKAIGGICGRPVDGTVGYHREFRLYDRRGGTAFPARIRIGISPDGVSSRLDRIKAWLDENCGAKRLGDDAFGHSAVCRASSKCARMSRRQKWEPRCTTWRERRRRDFTLRVKSKQTRELPCCRLPFLRFGNTSESILSLIVPYWR